MRRFALILFAGGVFSLASARSQPAAVPEVMDWCGMKLHLSADVRAAVAEQVKKLTLNATYQRTIAERAATYFPYIEDALRHMGVPDDLKYMVIQESAVQPDVVSTSMAVGFWQLKDYTATEMGITVSPAVDERKHVTAASVAAARYFIRSNYLYRNWLYAVIAYYEGPTGALPHTDPARYGTDEMNIEGKLHWYAVKALAHKLAYAEVVAQTPGKRLVAHSTEGETSVWVLAKRHSISTDELRHWNRWISTSPLPKEKAYSYFLPAAEAHAHRSDPMLALYQRPDPPDWVKRQQALTPPPSDQTRTQAPKPAEAQPPVLLRPTNPRPPITSDPWYDLEYTFAHAGEDLNALAARTGIGRKKLVKYNFSLAEPIAAGQRVLLRPTKKINGHVVRRGETLYSIAQLYGLKPAVLAERNGLAGNAPLAPGRKLWLRTQAPADPPLYQLDADEAPARPDSVRTAPADKPLPLVERPATYTVKPGDTVFSIALRHGLTPDALRSLNGLKSNTLSVGQLLKLR